MADYSKYIKPYEAFVKNLGYTVFYNGCKPDDSEVFLVLMIPNPDNANDFNLAFFHAITNTKLSLEGFATRVAREGKQQEFAKDVVNRIKGCTITKTDAVYGLLLSRKYTIDDVYGGGSLHLTPTMMKELSGWVNFKGGRSPLSPEQVRQRMNAK